jgi:hypothetical protein
VIASLAPRLRKHKAVTLRYQWHTGRFIRVSNRSVHKPVDSLCRYAGQSVCKLGIAVCVEKWIATHGLALPQVRGATIV